MAASSSQPETMKAECSVDNPKACYPETTVPVLHVTLLCGEWSSSTGGLSTINRELAIHLSNHSAVKVSLLVPEGACNTKEIREADGYGITIVEAKERAAYDRLDWLSIPPQDHSMDIVVGHGAKLGRQVQFIRDAAQFPNCKWVQVVHTAPEDLSRYKCYSDPISKGETKQESEVDLCKLADLVVPVGPRLKETYSSYLQRCKSDQDVLSITPGLFQREFGDLVAKQDPNEDGEFKVLLFGRGDDEDFELKGYNIAAQAFTDQRLKNKPYHLVFVGAPDGKQEEVRKKLLQLGIAEAQLTVRKFTKSREKLKDLLCEADLAIMPSKSEGFGLVALEALSAGLPILVGCRSGFAKALESVLHGHSCVVNSDDPVEWAKATEAVRVRHGMRLQEIKSLRASYGEMHSWKEQCEALVKRMWEMVNGPSAEMANKPRTNPIETRSSKKKATSAAGDQTEKSPNNVSQISRKLKTSGSSSNPDVSTKHCFLELNDEQSSIVHETLARQIQLYIQYRQISTKEGVSGLIEHIKKAYNLALESVGQGSLKITFRCPSLESLERLWTDFQLGHLNSIAERYLVTEDMKKKLNLENVKLKTTIEEQNYRICKKILTENLSTSAVLPVSNDFSSSTDSDQKEPSLLIDTSPEVSPDRKQLTHMERAEKAKVDHFSHKNSSQYGSCNMANSSTPREAVEEMIELLLENGGELELGGLVRQLSSHNRRLVSDFGALDFVKRFPQLFSQAKIRKSKSKVMVKLDIPLEFCSQAGAKGGCVAKGCSALHLCPFFIKGTCKLGLKCKRSHNYGDEHTVGVLNHFHLGFLTKHPSSSLLQKIFKMIVDESELQRTAAKRSVPDICKFYNKATCRKADNCPCLHVCERFIDGDCTFGEGCKREHGFSDPHNKKVLEEYDMDRISELKVLQPLKGRERKRTVSGSSDVEKPDKVSPKAVTPVVPVPTSKAKDEKEKDTEICGFNLRGKCNYGNNCIHQHTELPYLWEFSVHGEKWESFSSDLNTMLEQTYCDVKKGSCTVMIRGILHRVKFDGMTAEPVLPDDAVNYKSPKIRRLSTVSSVVAAAGHVYSTRWHWYWQDENNKWQSYDTPSDGHAVNTTSSQCLEREYTADKDCHSFSASHHHYTLYFKGWYQQNDVHKTKRPVRRRPAEFVTKQNMKDIAQRRRASPQSSSASSELDGLPSHWRPLSDGEDFSCVKLETICDEYKRTEKKFQDTMEGHHMIFKIERVQNPELWTKYTQEKGRMAKKAGKEPEERQLFHGTKSDTVDAICQQGFDWRMCGKHGTKYGKGSYFACKANYSHCYTSSQVTSRSYKQMFLARVLVGSYTNGDSALTRPPAKHPSTPLVLFDSCCDNTTNPSLFVVFENSQSYPEFLITYM